MTCASCGHGNRTGRKFCVECGAALPLACAACGAAHESGEKFCGECGARLPGSGGLLREPKRQPRAPERVSPPPGPGARKVVTIVFADLVGSTGLQERLDAEAVRQFMESYYAAMRGAVETFGGSVTQLLGDGVKAVFGIPRVAEDDAICAVRAAVAMQRAFRALAEQQQGRVGKTGLRVAVNTGEVVAGEGMEIIGDPVNVAARLQEQARDGDVVIGGSTQRLVGSLVTLDRLGSFTLKGRAEQVEAYRVVSLEAPSAASTAAFVGRDAELARLDAVYRAAVSTPAAKLAVLVASPGLGKSRLINELTHRLGAAATVLTAHCDAAGGASFAPLAGALRELLGSRGAEASSLPYEEGSSDRSFGAAIGALLPGADADRARIAAGVSALLSGSPASPEESFFVVRRLLAALAAARPVVLAIDDLHWAEPLLLDLVEHLVQWGNGVPLLVLVGARPELRELRSSLVTPGGFVSAVVPLGGLDAGAATRLAANVIGAADLPAAVATKVLATSEGNPLFVSELMRMLVQEGALTKEGERWTTGANLAALEMPPTIHALLAARIERLRPEESIVLEHAAVVGRQFSRAAVAALLPIELVDLDARLESLRRSELIERDSGWLLGEPVLRFHHALIRDAAYRRLLKGTRAELHERLADWFGSKVGGAPEHDETVGFHLERAYEHLRELGPPDEKGRGLGERAARHLAASGRRALARDDVPLAASLLGRAIECLGREDPARADLALDWCEALLSAGDVGPATRAIAELGRFADSSEEESVERNATTGPGDGPAALPVRRLRAWRTCFASQLTAMTAPRELQATARAVARAAEEFVELGDAAGEAKAHSVHAQALARLGRVGACEAALDKALAAARRADDRRRANAVLAGAPLAALWGPSPVTRASGRCLDVVRVLRITQGAPAVEAIALACQGVLEALRGRTEAARRMVASSRRMVEELGIAQRLFEADVFAARIDLLEGHAAAAERVLRGAYDGLRGLGLGIDAARAGALLARALLLQGKVDEAEGLTVASEQLAGDDLQAAIAWRGVRAEALARRGEPAAALALAGEAVQIAATTDALLDHADARLALAAALAASGQRDEAEAEEQRAIELWRAKGATLLVERAPPAEHTPPPARAAASRAAASPAPQGGTSPSAAASRVRDDRRTAVIASVEAALAARDIAAPAARLSPDQQEPDRRRVRQNAPTRLDARIGSIIAARDIGAFAGLLCERFELVHHPTVTTYGRRQMLTTWRSLFGAEQMAFRQEPLASLGDSLALHRHLVSAEGFAEEHLRAAGPIEVEEIRLTEVGEDGRVRRFELFAASHLADAIARLYQRHAELLPEGPARARAATIARAAPALLNMADVDRFASALAPDIRAIDHRNVGYGILDGADAALGSLRTLLVLAEQITWRIDDVLRLCPTGFLARATNTGVARAGGGVFERDLLALVIFGRDGLISNWEQFDVGQVAEARARFDELAPAPPSSPAWVPWESTATRAAERMHRARRARDAEGFAACLAPDLRHRDRRKSVQKDGDPTEHLADLRSIGDLPSGPQEMEVVATRGEHLALVREQVEVGDEDVGPSEVPSLLVVETNAGGEVAATVRLDPEDLEAAYAELDRLAAEAEAATTAPATAWWRTFESSLAARDWDRLLAACNPDLVARDHRLVGWGERRGPEEWVHTLRTLVSLAPDVRIRFDHTRTSRRAVLFESAWIGTREGGVFESPVLSVCQVDGTGRLLRLELWDPGRPREALARFADLIADRTQETPDAPADDAAEAPFDRGDLEAARAALDARSHADPLAAIARPNAAHTAMQRWLAAYDHVARTGDWDPVRAICSPALVFEDRRRLFLLSGGFDLMAASAAERMAIAARPQLELVGTAGDRIAIQRVLWSGGPSDGPFEIEYLGLWQVDEGGLLTAMMLFDADEAPAVRREAWRRWAALEPDVADTLNLVAELNDGLAAQDPEPGRARLVEDVLVVDRRRTSVGRIGGVGPSLDGIAALRELAPSARLELGSFWVAIGPRGGVFTVRHGGQIADGGAAERVDLGLLRHARGCATRFELFEPGDLPAALARFDELCREA